MLLEKALYDLSALDSSDCITVRCVKCKSEAKYGNTLEGITRLYFMSHWRVLNRDPRLNPMNEIAPIVTAVCDRCFEEFVRNISE